jgi:hypothetical protein
LKNIKNAMRILDPRGHYIKLHPLERIAATMGSLPSCIILDSETSFLDQVAKAVGKMDMSTHKMDDSFDMDIDGSFTCTDEQISINCEAMATGIIERDVDGRREAIYFYANGMIIIEDQETDNDMPTYYVLRMTN